MDRIAAMPWYWCGAGGMASQASSVSSATTPSMSAATYASAKRRASVALPVRPRPRCPAAPGLVAALLQRGAGALQRALDRGRAGAEHVGHLAGGEAEHVAQHERGGLAGRHALQAGDERQLDRLGWLVAGIGARSGVGDAVEQGVGIGLQPGDLAAPAWARAAGTAGSARPGSGGWRSRSALRHWLVAMRYSQERSDDRASNPASPRQAASIVSCSMSSASVSEPDIR